MWEEIMYSNLNAFEQDDNYKKRGFSMQMSFSIKDWKQSNIQVLKQYLQNRSRQRNH